MRILHLSDLHYNNSFNYGELLDKLKEDLQIFSNIKKINFICVTGDIFDKGDTSQIKINEAKIFFDNILNVLPESKIIFCPGNHDVNLKKINKITMAGLKNYQSIGDLGSVIRGEDVLPHIEDYINFTKLLNPNHYCINNFYHTEIISFGDKNIGFASLNSSWLSQGGGEKDRNNLMICREQLEDAYIRIKSCDIKIAMMHHTLDWLEPAEAKYCELFFHKNFNILLNGHNHNNSAFHIKSNIGELALSNTASLFNDRNKYNSYNLIDICENEFKIYAREYFAERNAFDSSNRFSSNGELSFALNSFGLEFNVAGLIESSNRHNEILLSHTNSTVAPKTIKQIFVSPPISNKSILEVTSDSENIQKLFDLTEISNTDNNIAFIGRRETGRSTLLNHIAADRNKDFNNSSILGFVVDLSICKETEAAVFEECTKFYESEIRRSDVKAIFSAGKAVVCFDNFDKNNPKITRIIFEIIEKYPLNRYVFGLLEDDIVAEQKAFLLGKNIDVYFIHPYGKKHTKKLALNWFGVQSEDIAGKLNSLESLLNGLKIPRTPFLVSALLWVIENSSSNINIINHSAAIDLLIDGLLEKIKDTNLRKSNDVHDQKHFLTKFAKELFNRNEFRITIVEFDRYISEYFNSRMLSTSSLEFSDSLYRKGILFKRDGYVSFKFDCFRAYFLSRNFNNDPDFLRFAIRKDNIVSFTSELDYYTGLLKDNSNVLIEVNSITEDLFKDLEEYSKLKFDFFLMNDSKQDGNAIEQDCTNLINALDDDFIDMEVESKLEVVVEGDEQVFIDEQSKIFDPLINVLSYARVISNINRNLELIDDSELKIRSFENTIKLWTLIFLSSYHLVDKSNEVANLRLNEEKAEIFKKMATVLIPQTIVTLMAESLANPKMDILYNKVINNYSESFERRLMCVILSSEASTKGWIENIEKIMSQDSSKSSREMLAQVLFFRLLNISLTKFLSEFDKKRVQAIASDLFITMHGFTGVKKDQQEKLKNSFRQNFNKKMLNYLD